MKTNTNKQKALVKRNTNNLRLQEGLAYLYNTGEETNDKSPLWIVSKIEIKYKDQSIDATFSLPIMKELETEEDFDEYGWIVSQHIKFTLMDKLKNK